jgi:hypothetical protein
MSFSSISICSGEPQTFEKLDACLIVGPHRTVNQRGIDETKGPLCDKTPDPFAAPVGPDNQMFDLAESEADPVYADSPNDQSTVCFYYIINPAFYNIYASSLKGEPIISIN